MEQREIEAFLTLADELHLGRTAERLHLTTAGVSQAIKTLERRVGAPLFERIGLQVELTPIGRQLETDLRPAYERTREALRRAIIAGRGIDGVLRVGFVNAVAGRLVLSVADVFRARHPRCAVEVREAQVGNCLAALRTGDVDVLVATFPLREPDLATGSVLISEPRLLAAPSGHPFARRASVSVEDLARVEVPATEYWKGVPATATLVFIGEGQGVSPVGVYVRRFHARPDGACVPFRDASPVEWGLIWRASGATGRVRAFEQTARDVVQAQGGPEAA